MSPVSHDAGVTLTKTTPSEPGGLRFARASLLELRVICSAAVFGKVLLPYLEVLRFLQKVG
jgi:hypothetical protein